MPAPPVKEEGEEPEDWLVTYADAITLLMAFFVMLLNFSKIDIPAFEEAAAGIANEIGMGPKEKSPISILKLNIQDVVYQMQADQVVKVETDDKGVVIELASSAFYESGSADFRPAALPVLEKLGNTLLEPRYERYIVEIEGHTDDVPINTARYPSNWELSSGRSTRVARFFIDQGMVPQRIKASGYAATRPKVPNRRPDGTPIPENQAENRRVIVRLYPMSLEEQEKYLENQPPPAPSETEPPPEETSSEPAPEAAPAAPAATDGDADEAARNQDQAAEPQAPPVQVFKTPSPGEQPFLQSGQ